MSLPLLLALACPPTLAQDVLVITLDGSEVRGELKQRKIELTTAFGEAVVRSDKLARIEFGDPARVVTTGGVTLEGQLKIKRLRVETESGTETLTVADLRTLDVLVDGLAMLRTGFYGSWATSFGPMQLEQEGSRVTGTYGFQDEFVISGDVEGNQLTFEAKEPNGTSAGSFDLWEDGDTFAGQFRFNDGDERFWGAYRLQPVLAEAKPGEITHGQSQSGLNYHLRVPKDYDPGKRYPALAFFHGSNMNSESYVATIAAVWPELADDYLLVGFDGEKLSSRSADGARYFNFTYINFSGHEVGQRWRYRQSPGLVAEALDELRDSLSITHWFAGGHSQGGFLTYALVMFYPDKIAGAFPMSCNLLVQCEPSNFDDEQERALQRAVALAPIHGRRDTVVDFSSGEYCYQAMQDGGFPALRFFAPESVGHEFNRLPLEEAVRWLEVLHSGDSARLVTFGEEQLEQGHPRSATAAAVRAASADDNGTATEAIAALHAAVDSAAQSEAEDLEQRIAENKDGSWVDDFWEFRRRFHFTPAAQTVIAAYAGLREKHAAPAQKLFNAARGERDEVERQEKYAELLERYYASKWYPLVKRWVK